MCNASCNKFPACSFCIYCASEGYAIYRIHSGKQHQQVCLMKADMSPLTAQTILMETSNALQ